MITLKAFTINKQTIVTAFKINYCVLVTSLPPTKT